jgi:hypothetical protein
MQALVGSDRAAGRRRRCIVFVHIPKTGGRTLSTALRYKHPSGFLRLSDKFERPEKLQEIPLEDRRAAQVISGHISYGVHRYVPQECEYITILREPVARVISRYNHVLSRRDAILGDPQHWLHRFVRSGMDFEKFIQAGVDPRLDNGQTRVISGRSLGDEQVSLGREALEDAKRNLEKFLVVGLTERFDESFILVRRALGWKLPMYETDNVSTRRMSEPPTQAVIELIRERNELDLELYEYARELFSGQVDRHGASFQREVAAFRALNRIPNAIGPRIPTRLRHPLRSLLPR